MTTGIGNQLRACGRGDLPRFIRVRSHLFRLNKVFKHDFFAATGLYDFIGNHYNDHSVSNKVITVSKQVILKLARRSDFLGIPLAWLGVILCQHEIYILRRLQGLNQIPRLLGKFGKTGLVYEYIPGRSLDERPELPDNFFDRLETLLSDIHSRRIIYLDLNKRGNILIGDDNRPFMIDFQISQHIAERFCGSSRLARFILKTAQKEDFYHLFKHKRRLRRDLMSEEQLRNSRRFSTWISLHRLFARPLTRLRRGVLHYLYKKDRLITDGLENHHSETNPDRWGK
jgi:serine/threonine protein kinase